MSTAPAAPSGAPREVPGTPRVRTQPRESRRSAWLARGLAVTVRPALDLAARAGEIAVAAAGPDVLRSAPARAAFAAPELIARLLPVPAGATVEQIALPACRAEWVRAGESASDRVVIHLHGGAFVTGGPGTHRHLAYRLSAEADAAVLSVDYRMPPRHSVADAIADAVAAFRAVLDSGVPASRVVLSGDSAGGGLAILAARAASLADMPTAAAIVCLSPWSDYHGPPDLPDAWVPPRALRLISTALIKPGGVLGNDLAARQTDLAGLPPVLIHAGGHEALAADAQTLAAHLHDAGVDVELCVWEQQVHVFHAFWFLPEAQRAVAQVGQFIKRQTTTHAPRRER